MVCRTQIAFELLPVIWSVMFERLSSQVKKMILGMTLEERVERARGLFNSGYNCAQAVLLAYNDIVGMDDEAAAVIASSFGGGMGRLREVCGAVSGMSMLASLISPAPDPNDRAARTANYALVQDFAERFRAENGSIVCRELLGLGVAKESPEPSPRTSEYYSRRPCAEYVASAARIVGRYLAEKGYVL